VYVVSDVNIHLERPSDPDACEFSDDLAAHGLVNCVTLPTHDRGGMLDIVATRSDPLAPHVDVIDIGLSDRHLLRWTVSADRHCPAYVSTSRR